VKEDTIIEKSKKLAKIKVGKTLTTTIVGIFVIIGLAVVIFHPEPENKMTAFAILLDAIWPYVAPIMFGYAGKKFIETYMDKK
jgi:mannitol-specific phosphotransferase system IIBC component